MSRKGENIYKRKDGRWEGRYALSRLENGKIRYGYIYAYSYTECKQKLIHAKANIPPKITVTEEKRDTLATIANLWLKYKAPQVKPATMAKYNALLNIYIFPKLGDKQIDTLSKKEIQDFSNDLLLSGKQDNTGLSPKTVSDIVSLLRLILRYASENDYKVSSDICKIKIKQEPKQLLILTREEQQILYDNLVLSNDLRDIGILVSLFTGIRIGELCALRWEHISLENATIFVCSTLERIQDTANSSDNKTKIIIASPKSVCSVRKIPLPDFLIEILNTIENKKGYLLTSSEENYVEPRSMQYHFKKVLKINNITEMNFHSLRHTFATRCVELGFDVKTLSEILGHASVNITMNRYVHPSFDLKRENMKRLSELLSVK